MKIQSKTDAQKRVDQIGHFQAELQLLENTKIIALTEPQHISISDYHSKLIEQLALSFDIDINRGEKQLSLGMRIASFLGALGLGASIFFLFYQFWGGFSTTLQIAILTTAPLIGLAATMYISGKEKTGYFTKLLGLVTLTCFVLNISMLAQIYNIAPTENGFLAWAMLAFLLAYSSDTRLLLAAGILCLSAYLSAKAGVWGGFYWLYFGKRPENFFAAAAVLFLISTLPHSRYSGFTALYRVSAMLIFLLPVLVLANWGGVSYLPLDNERIETIYQLAGFIFSAAAIWLGIKRGWVELVNCGVVFFTIFLYTKFYRWWWDWMPKYLFFLIIGLTAILMLLLLQRLRKTRSKAVREASA